ncbi:MAG: CBS domain-containing protein, partial [Pseudomonadota bacterium]
MGDLVVAKTGDEKTVRAFMRAILADVRALEHMIENGIIEKGARRVGAEQEMYLVNSAGFAAPVAVETMAQLKDDHRFTHEVASFNLEANLDVLPLDGAFLSTMERQLDDALSCARKAAGKSGADALLTGILPTLRRRDLTADNLTPLERYHLLNEASLASQNGSINLVIDGLDRFEAQFDCVAVEGANTSFQLHYQVDAQDSARLYNLAQLITAPLLACAANSPLLLGKRVWQETRIAVFERAFDDRSDPEHDRAELTRVGFGASWLESSMVELFHDNVARFQVIMTRPLEEDPMDVIARGETPKLKALQLHNGTVWRWNRACYGITDGKPHLRIENRVLPGGPTVRDAIANAAFFYGLMKGCDPEYGEVKDRVPFADARANFLASAHNGLDVTYSWLDGKRISARDLILDELLPLARRGLASLNTPDADIDRYLGTIEGRARSGRTGAAWLLNGVSGVPASQRQAVSAAAVKTLLERQQHFDPVHQWAGISETHLDGRAIVPATVSDIMSRDVFTVRPDDVVELATSVMEWKHIRHVPVEDSDGRLVGLLTARELLHVGDRQAGPNAEPPPVSQLMTTALPTV